MTLKAAATLDQAFATYLAVAGHDDSDPISHQSPSWYPLAEVKDAQVGPPAIFRSSPYDFAAALVRSLLPHAYNYDASLWGITEQLWVLFVDCLEILPFDHEAVKEILVDKNTRDPYLCDTCGWDEKSIQHYKECV